MEEGLRERKKRETRQRIADMAMGLFMIHGFEKVTVADVARAADVSVNTVFNYFGTKEDLFLDRQDDAGFLPAHVVEGRLPGESVVAAFRRDFLAAIEARDWRYGLNEGAEVFTRLVAESPSLLARMRELEQVRSDNLARALAEATDADPDDLRPRLVAGQVLETTRLLSRQATRRTLAGESWSEIQPWLREQAAQAFELLEKGIGDYGQLLKSASPPTNTNIST
ncbi:MAG: TetR family transcriptional regulator [Nonomuraea sp.]|nr:TetR family transcriptional regulator [Nonomuraea sp.]